MYVHAVCMWPSSLPTRLDWRSCNCLQPNTTQNRRRHRRLQRSKSERARGRGERQIALEEVTTGVEGGESCNPRLEAGESRNPRLEPPISPQSHDLSQQRHHHQQQHQRGSSSMSPEATNFTPGADTEEAAPSAITVTVTTATAAATSPTSNSERDSYRRNNEGHEGDDDNDGVRSDSNEMFRELVMIMDATPLPSPRRKLAEVPEDVDVSCPCSFIYVPVIPSALSQTGVVLTDGTDHKLFDVSTLPTLEILVCAYDAVHAYTDETVGIRNIFERNPNFLRCVPK